MQGTQHIAAIGGARTIFLEVGTDNPAAQSLYEKSGYTLVGRRPDYYLRDDGKRVAALLLRLTLDAQNGINS
jgi:ribosomal-protein-alanine N-acetyltransferase